MTLPIGLYRAFGSLLEANSIEIEGSIRVFNGILPKDKTITNRVFECLISNESLYIAEGVSVNGDLIVNGNLTIKYGLIVKGNIRVKGNLYSLCIGEILCKTDMKVGKDINVKKLGIRVNHDLSVAGNLITNGCVIVNNDMSVKNIESSSPLDIKGNFTAASDVKLEHCVEINGKVDIQGNLEIKRIGTKINSVLMHSSLVVNGNLLMDLSDIMCFINGNVTINGNASIDGDFCQGENTNNQMTINGSLRISGCTCSEIQGSLFVNENVLIVNESCVTIGSQLTAGSLIIHGEVSSNSVSVTKDIKINKSGELLVRRGLTIGKDLDNNGRLVVGADILVSGGLYNSLLEKGLVSSVIQTNNNLYVNGAIVTNSTIIIVRRLYVKSDIYIAMKGIIEVGEDIHINGQILLEENELRSMNRVVIQNTRLEINELIEGKTGLYVKGTIRKENNTHIQVI